MKLKRFSQTKILNTNNPLLGFSRNRNYDMDLSRLGKMNTSQRELQMVGELNREIRKMNKELNTNNRGGAKWQGID